LARVAVATTTENIDTNDETMISLVHTPSYNVSKAIGTRRVTKPPNTVKNLAVIRKAVLEKYSTCSGSSMLDF
jgi:hypothetical protein